MIVWEQYEKASLCRGELDFILYGKRDREKYSLKIKYADTWIYSFKSYSLILNEIWKSLNIKYANTWVESLKCKHPRLLGQE